MGCELFGCLGCVPTRCCSPTATGPALTCACICAHVVAFRAICSAVLLLTSFIHGMSLRPLRTLPPAVPCVSFTGRSSAPCCPSALAGPVAPTPPGLVAVCPTTELAEFWEPFARSFHCLVRPDVLVNTHWPFLCGH